MVFPSEEKKKGPFKLFSLPHAPLLEEIFAKTHRWDRLQFPFELPWPFQVLFIRAGLSNRGGWDWEGLPSILQFGLGLLKFPI